MKISVVIPNYNNEKYLEECIKSLEKQTLKDFEVIIVDDGSTDKSIEVIEKIQNKSKLNIKIIKQFNQNASIARNKGIELTNSDYIYFLDSDDEMYSEHSLELLINKISDFDLIIGNYQIINEDSNVIGEYNNNSDLLDFENNYKYCKLSPVPSNKLFKVDLIKKYHLYFSNVRIGQDLNFYLKYLSICKRIKIIDDKIYKYRIVSNGMSNSKNLNFLDIYTSFLEVKKYYIKNNNYENYQKYITLIALSHYHGQLKKVNNFKSHKQKKMIYSYFNYCIADNNKTTKNKNKYYIKEYKKYIIKKLLLKTNLYNFLKR